MKTSSKRPTISSPMNLKNSGDVTAALVRNLTISGPRPKKQVETSLKSNIILVAKYSFDAESYNELSISKGDILKLLDRPGNGWLLVKLIDKVVEPGLIPAFYVDIAINDVKNPITLNWLQSNTLQRDYLSSLNEQTYLHLQLKQAEAAPLTINNKAYPISVSINNFLLYNQRYWYRLDVVLSDHSQIYLCRYYQDFYNLHINLLNLLNKSNSDKFKLPKLPEPIPSRNNTDEGEDAEERQLQMLVQRCADLNKYINSLILNRIFQLSDVLIDWLDVSFENLPGFKLTPGAIMSNDAINNEILPESVDVAKEYYRKREARGKEEVSDESIDNTEPLSHSSSVSSGNGPPQRKKSLKNIFNHYQQFPQPSPMKRVISSSSSNSNISTGSTPNTPKSAFNSTLQGTPFNQVGGSFKSNSTNSSPILCKSSPSASHVRCELTNFNDEIVAIRFRKSSLRSINDLKHLIKQKVYYSKLFIKLPNSDNWENIDVAPFNLTEFLKRHDTLSLKLA